MKEIEVEVTLLEIKNLYELWKQKTVGDSALSADLMNLSKEEIFDRFYRELDFGTAGLRSTMYMGIGCMNRFTVAQTTRGIAALVKNQGGAERGVAIAYDSRNHSAEFARAAACVLAGAGVKSYIFK